MAKRETEKEEIKEQLTPFKVLLIALVESKFVQGEVDIFAYKEYPDAEVHTYRDPKTGVLRENIRIDVWDRGALVLLLKSGLKLRIVSKQGHYYMRAAPGVEIELSKWIEEYRKNQKRESEKREAERARR